MSNPHKGEVSFRAGDKDYTLRFSVDALAELETALDRNINSIASEIQDPTNFSVKTLRTIFWAGLQDRHRMSFDDARDVLRALSMAQAVELVSKAFTLAFPEAEEPANPPQPGAQEKPGIGPVR